jgi:penicillin-binding protein 1B
MSRPGRRFFFSRLALVLLILTVAAAAVLVIRAERQLSRLALGGLGESFSTRVYSAATEVGPEAPRDARLLLLRLRRLGYRQTAAAKAPGEYCWKAPVLAVFLRGFTAPLPPQAPGLFKIEFDPDGATKVFDASGTAVPRIWLEPELAAELSGAKKVRREPAQAEELPQALKDAVVATEDKRFYRHWGIDPLALLRSAWHDLAGRSELRGGSTITQQLAKNLFLGPQKTLGRKLAEAAFAFYLELRLGKERILTVYLNHIYMGQDGVVAVAGVKAAADFYFGRSLDRLSLGQCAMLAGIIRSPYRYNPRRDPDEARQRRDFVLGRMREEGFITAAELSRARQEPLAVALRPSGNRLVLSYFVAELVRQVLPRYGEEELFCDGLSLYTTMDPLLQAAAQEAVSRVPSQGALVALAPEDGRVLALVGGRDFLESQFDRATRSRRQPGSAFKPFLYGAGLEKGYTAASLLEDRPKSFPSPAGQAPWQPHNYDGVYFGTTTLRGAIAHSLNSAALDLAGRIGPSAVAEFARRLGIRSPLDESLALALGTSEVSLIELTSAYAAFANGGLQVEPRMLNMVCDAAGQVMEFDQGERRGVLDPARAYLMTSLLGSVISEGTAKDLTRLGFTRPCAGKTGTTNDGKDAWFVGYTPRLLAGVWVGDDRNQALELTGAKNALPVWAAFMRAASEGPAAEFVRPPGLVTVVIDPASGLLAVSGCPQRRSEIFLAGTQPTTECPLHRSGVLGWLKKWFGRR